MLLRRVAAQVTVVLVLDHELCLSLGAGRVREASGGGARGAKRLSAGVPAVSWEGRGRPGAAQPRP